MKKNIFLISLLSFSLIGCGKITDPHDAKKETINKEQANEYQEKTINNLKDKVSDISTSSLFGLSVNANLGGSFFAHLINTEGVESDKISALALGSLSLKANIDLDGLRKYNKSNNINADFGNTEIYLETGIEGNADYPSSFNKLSDLVRERFTASIKDKKVSTCTSILGEASYNSEVIADDEYNEFADEFISYLDSLKNDTEKDIFDIVEDNEIALVTKSIIDDFKEFMNNDITPSKVIADINSIFSLSSSNQTLISNLLETYKATDFSKIIDYSLQGSKKIGYILNYDLNFDELKNTINSFFEKLETYDSLKDTIPLIKEEVNSYLPNSLICGFSMEFDKNWMLKNVDWRFNMKGSLEGEKLIMVGDAFDDELARNLQQYSKTNYEIDAYFNFEFELGNQKININ